MSEFIEHRVIIKMLDTALTLLREAMRKEVMNNRLLKINLLEAQYRIEEAISFLNMMEEENK